MAILIVMLVSVLIVQRFDDFSHANNQLSKQSHKQIGIYLAKSKQRSCALAAATSFNGILCTATGGYLVERLPDCSPKTVSHMEQNLAKLIQMNGDGGALPTNLLLEGKFPVDIASILLNGLGMELLAQPEPKPKCPCSAEKLFRSLHQKVRPKKPRNFISLPLSSSRESLRQNVARLPL